MRCLYENVSSSDFDLLAGERQDTPELEKLFNQTVGASKLDDDPEFLHYVNSKSSKLASISRQSSTLMTPASLGSRRPAATSSRLSHNEKVGTVKDCTTSLYKFPFSRSTFLGSSSLFFFFNHPVLSYTGVWN
ncbi:hypothetical protein OESDEN_12245 [Oesophagostomum dentatum]|uniref:Uncharacterized protein n=1 Tax=Oesophagostomum dentatum TaxID=61180 RepID=A0A0B1SWS1_OESDE|nr:hypothetical protein OESDEN_12245 [Oesophagostomum dentatum]